MRLNCLLLLIFVLAACSHTPSSNISGLKAVTSDNKNISSGTELQLIKMGLINVSKLDSNIMVDLKYASTDNFLKKNLYGTMKSGYLQALPAKMIHKAQHFLDSIKPGFRLKIFDAARPNHIQKLMWDSVDLPANQKHLFLAFPVTGSVHNYGCAVDITIVDGSGKELDMGTPYDFSGKTTWPSIEEKLLLQKMLTEEEIANRKLLRKVMNIAGFKGINTEWWHFEAFRLDEAKKKYKIIK